MRLRCIVIEGVRRCHRPAAKRMGDLYSCTCHGLIQLAIMSDWLSPSSRLMLAQSRWETPREGQALINRSSRSGA